MPAAGKRLRRRVNVKIRLAEKCRLAEDFFHDFERLRVGNRVQQKRAIFRSRRKILRMREVENRPHIGLVVVIIRLAALRALLAPQRVGVFAQSAQLRDAFEREGLPNNEIALFLPLLFVVGFHDQNKRE